MKDEYMKVAREYEITPNGFVNFDRITRKSKVNDWQGYAPADIEISICIQFLKQLPLTKKTFTLGSYGLKHNAENWAAHYVCNGALLLAAHIIGIPVDRPQGDNSPNGMLPISKRWRMQDLEPYFGSNFYKERTVSINRSDDADS